MSQEILYGWSTSDNLVTGAGVQGGENGVQLQCTLERDSSVTVQFNIKGDDGGTVNCQAEITSIVHGNQVVRVITVIDGASITVRGRVINVVVRDYTNPFLSSGQQYQVAILVTLGVRASISHPPFLQPLLYAPSNLDFQNGNFQQIGGVLVLNPGDYFYVPVPANSGVNAVLVTAGNAAGIAYTQNQVLVQQNTIFPSAMKTYDPLVYSGFVPLSANVASIGLSLSVTATEPVEMAVVFGVDG